MRQNDHHFQSVSFFFFFKDLNFSFYFIGKINALSGFAEKLVFLPSYSTCIVYISIYKWRCLPFVCEELYATGFCRFLSLFRLGPFYCKNSSTGSTQFDDSIILYVNVLRCLCYFTSSRMWGMDFILLGSVFGFTLCKILSEELNDQVLEI